MTDNVKFDENMIFKYGTLEHLENTLIKNSLGFSIASKLNDPFENAHIFQINRINRGEGDPSSKKYRDLIESKNEFLNKAKISCFSRTPYEPLMWSHYSDKHYGICYCFDKNQLTPYKLCSSYQDIIYSSHLPKIYYEEDKSSDEHLKQELNRVLMTKSLNWSYEKEFRILLNNDVENKFRNQSLKALIIGFNAAIWHKKRILEVVKKANATRESEIKVYYANLSTLNYEVLIANEPTNSQAENTNYFV
jgi:hypothetical protein